MQMQTVNWWGRVVEKVHLVRLYSLWITNSHSLNKGFCLLIPSSHKTFKQSDRCKTDVDKCEQMRQICKCQNIIPENMTGSGSSCCRISNNAGNRSETLDVVL